MKRLIGVCNHNFRRGIQIGKMHLAFGGVGKAFCGRDTMVETGDYLSHKWVVTNQPKICKMCLLIWKPKHLN